MGLSSQSQVSEIIGKFGSEQNDILEEYNGKEDKVDFHPFKYHVQTNFFMFCILYYTLKSYNEGSIEEIGKSLRKTIPIFHIQNCSWCSGY